ncbi:MAG: ArsR family transcriptional regulator [archaeon]
MERARFKVVIRSVERPFSDAFDEDFNWILRCLGFFEPMDRDKTAASIFREIVKATEKGRLLSSTDIAEMVKMSRGAVVNHLSNLQRSGLIIKEGRYYKARSKSIFRTIREIEEDIDRVFRQMEQTAKELDEEMGVETRE